MGRSSVTEVNQMHQEHQDSHHTADGDHGEEANAEQEESDESLYAYLTQNQTPSSLAATKPTAKPKHHLRPGNVKRLLSKPPS